MKIEIYAHYIRININLNYLQKATIKTNDIQMGKTFLSLILSDSTEGSLEWKFKLFIAY